MFISPSSLTLNFTLSASGTIPGSPFSSKSYPLPSSTALLPQADHSVSVPSFSTQFSPGYRLGFPSELSPTMLSSGAASYPSFSPRLHILSLSQSSPSASIRLVSARAATDTAVSAGTSLTLPSTFSSNYDASRSLTFPPTLSQITPSSAFWSSLSLSNSTNSRSTSESTFSSTPTPTSTSSALTSISSSSPTARPSHSSPPSSSSSFPSSPTRTSTTSFPTSSSTRDTSTTLDPTTITFATTVVQTIGPSSSSLSLPSTSIYTLTSVVPGPGGTTTVFVTTSNVLSTEPPGAVVNSTVPLSSASIAGIVLGIVGAFAFSALWLFCARRRHRELVGENTLIPPEGHAPGPLNDEIFDGEVSDNAGSMHSEGNYSGRTGAIMEERHAGILAALRSAERLGRGYEAGSTTGVYGSRHDTLVDMNGDDELVRASSPTLPLHVLPPDDPPHMIPLFPPPISRPAYQINQPAAPPPSAYYNATRRRGSPGPDVTTCFGGYSIAPSCNSHYARSQTLGSGSGSGSVDALSRTRTGSEDPLLGIGKVTEASADASTPGGIGPTAATEPGDSYPGLGSAFGSPAASMYCPSSVYPALQYDASGSQDARTVSGSGSYGYPRSGTPSSFDVLRSVSSQGALSSMYSQTPGQGQGFKFGFHRAGSVSSGSTGKKTGSNRHSFGVPPTSFKAWKDWSSAISDKEKGEKQSLRDRRSRPRSGTSASTTGSVDEKQERGSPAVSVRAFLERLRRGGHSSSLDSSSKDLPSPTQAPMDTDPEKAMTGRVTPPPIRIEAATPHRRRFSFILSNPDPHPPSLYSTTRDVIESLDTAPHEKGSPDQNDALVQVPHNPEPALQPAMPFPTGFRLAAMPSPALTEELLLTDGLLHPRLQNQGCSDASLRDFEDYSRPIGGVVKNRLYSTTTFGTQDEGGSSPSQGTPVKDIVTPEEQDPENDEVGVSGTSSPAGVPRDSWSVEDPSHPTTAHRSPYPNR